MQEPSHTHWHGGMGNYVCVTIINIVWRYSDVGNQDRVVIQELIKTVAQVNQLETSSQREFKGMDFLISLSVLQRKNVGGIVVLLSSSSASSQNFNLYSKLKKVLHFQKKLRTHVPRTKTHVYQVT